MGHPRLTEAIRHPIRVPEAAIRLPLRAQMVMRLRRGACTASHLFKDPQITERILGMGETTTGEAVRRMVAIPMLAVTVPIEVLLAQAHMVDILSTMRALVRARLSLSRQLRGRGRQ